MPEKVKINAHQGMTNSQLENSIILSFDKMSACQTKYWPIEIYSHGKCIRELTGYPKFLPLYVYACHGVTVRTKLQPHELDNSSKVHLTWNPIIEKAYSSSTDRNVIYCSHP
jgi:hypothetical protein